MAQITQLGSSPISNLWLGASAIDFASVNEKGDVTIVTANTYLDTIKYVVDIHVPKEQIAQVVSGGVGIAYTTEGNDFSDPTFADADARGIVKIFQGEATHTLNFAAEALGRYPATLKENFVGHLNSGADTIKLGNSSAKLLDEDAVAADLSVSFSNAGPAVEGIQCSAIPKAISAQMQGFAADENLLRLVAAADSYNNLMTFPLSGSKDSGNAKKAMHIEVRGKSNDTANVLFDETVSQMLNSDDMGAAGKEIKNVYPGHLIVAAIFNAYPPRAQAAGSATDLDNNNVEMDLDNVATSDKLWVRKDIGGTVPDVGDVLVLNNTTGIVEELVLQYVLKTKMTLISRDGDPLNKTLKSPDNEYASGDDVHILYNIKFDDVVAADP